MASSSSSVQFIALRVRILWSYPRIFRLENDHFVTIDPTTFLITHTFTYSSIVNLLPRQDKNTFSFEYNKQAYVYKCTNRELLLSYLLKMTFPFQITSEQTSIYNCERIKKDSTRCACKLQVTPYAIIEISNNNTILQEYSLIYITEIAIDTNNQCIMFLNNNHIKIFCINEYTHIIDNIILQYSKIGHGPPKINDTDIHLNHWISHRISIYYTLSLPIATFDVNKHSNRYTRPIARQLHICETAVIEKDPSGYQYISYHNISSITLLIRHSNNIREFSIQYDNSNSNKCILYTCSLRDTVLSVLLDVCHAHGNLQVYILTIHIIVHSYIHII